MNYGSEADPYNLKLISRDQTRFIEEKIPRLELN